MCVCVCVRTCVHMPESLSPSLSRFSHPSAPGPVVVGILEVAVRFRIGPVSRQRGVRAQPQAGREGSARANEGTSTSCLRRCSRPGT